MEFTAIIVFLVLYFVRPQDWIPGFEGLNVIKPIMAIGFWGLLTRPPRQPTWKVMSTPHEWVMVCYLLYGLYCDPDWSATFSALMTVAGFYFLTSQALNDSQRIDVFFRWWAGSIVFMCIIGVATDMGIDITNARELLNGQLGRLCLNTWLMDNPNALGHTGVTAFPLIYFTMFYRRDIGTKILAVPLIILCGMCVVATESKGAYLSGACGIAAALLIGRTPVVQVILACLLLVSGSAVTTMLPRMVDREAMRFDEGVMGRALAFEAGRTQYMTGVTGWSRFMAEIEWEGETVDKSTHSSHVQIGADLGPIGMFLFLSVLCLSARSALTLKTDDDNLERCRMLIFSLIVGYYASGWMINRSYHTEYFLLAGAATAFHKLAQERIRKNAGLLADDEDSDEEDAVVEKDPLPVFAVQASEDGELAAVTQHESPVMKKLWHRYGFIDFAIAYAVFSFTIWFWDYLIDYFIPK